MKSISPQEPVRAMGSPFAAVMPRRSDYARVEPQETYIPGGATPSRRTEDSPIPRAGAVPGAASVGAAMPGATAVPIQLLILGAPGAGKSTQGRILAEKLSVPFISTGEILRDGMAKGSLPPEVAEQVRRGELAPSELVFELVSERLQQPDVAAGFILDGYPRQGEQLPQFEALRRNLDLDGLRVVGLEVERDELIERMTDRGREGETLEVIHRRLDVYDSETRPVIDYFKARGEYLPIDGNGSIEETAARIDQALGRAGARR